jgi:GNAT superfamily N-acetyltransferase
VTTVGTPVQIDRLGAGDGERWRRIRLTSLRDAPYAFSTTYADAAQWDTSRWEAQVVELATFVAVVDGRDVGVARGAPDRSGDVRELISMWVAPSARRQGIGAQLIESVAAWANSEGAATLVLAVAASNSTAIALYERAGFVRFGDEPRDTYEADEVQMVKGLA